MRPDAEGLQNAEAFAGALVRSGRTVVSFLENETDAQVARSILNLEGESQAGLLVLSATGPDRLYPPAMRDLYHLAADRGLILTPLMPGIGVSEQTLEQRSVVCAYLCSDLLVLQAELPGKLIRWPDFLPTTTEMFMRFRAASTRCFTRVVTSCCAKEPG